MNVKWVNHGVESNTNEPEWGPPSPYLRESFDVDEWRDRLVQLAEDGAPEYRPLRHCAKCTRVAWPGASTGAAAWAQQLMDDSAAQRQALVAAAAAAAAKREAVRVTALARAASVAAQPAMNEYARSYSTSKRQRREPPTDAPVPLTIAGTLSSVGGERVDNDGRGWCYYLAASQHPRVQCRILALQQHSAVADAPLGISAHDVALSLINHLDADGEFARRKATFVASGLSATTSAHEHIVCYRRLQAVSGTSLDELLDTSLWGRDFDDGVVAAAFECSVVVIRTVDGVNVSSVRISAVRASGRGAGCIKFKEHRAPTTGWTVAEFTSVLQRSLPAPGLRLQHDIVMLYDGSHYELVASVPTNALASVPEALSAGAAVGVSDSTCIEL